MKSVMFTGIPYGDYECFCWLVDAENFEKVMGRPPHAEMDAGRNCGDGMDVTGLYRLYPPFSGKATKQLYLMAWTEE